MLRAATSNLTWDHQQHQFVFDPYFVLAIDREHLLTQTLQKISQASHVELRKSLKIVFKGEDAVDAGGVLKEFMVSKTDKAPGTDSFTTTIKFEFAHFKTVSFEPPIV